MSQNTNQETVLVNEVTVSQSTLSLEIGDTVALTASISPENATNQTLRWYSENSAIATVSNGVVTAVSNGTTSIVAMATDGSLSLDRCTVNVGSQTVIPTDLTLSDNNLPLELGTTYTLTATVIPENATNKNIAWISNDESIVTVSGGVITAVGEGSTYITVVAIGNPSVNKRCDVTVSVKVTDVTINESSLSLEIGDTVALTASVTPENATSKTIAWYSDDETVATVNNGMITAVGNGITTITAVATDGSASIDRCGITVSPQTVKVTGITIVQRGVPMEIGDVYALSTEIVPANATNKTLGWYSSNYEVAIVSNGIVTAVGNGDAVITAVSRDGSNVTDSSQITVTTPEIQITDIILNAKTLKLHTSDSYPLSATVFPEDATNKTLIWSSSNTNVAIINNNKLVCGTGTGESIITATAQDGSGVSAQFTVTVVSDAIEVTKLILRNKALTLHKGESYNLSATVIPENAANQTLIWSSSNSDVATVDNGYVIACNTGNTRISVETSDGTEIVKYCDVEVKEEREKIYKIVNVATNKCLTVVDAPDNEPRTELQVELKKYSGNRREKWTITKGVGCNYINFFADKGLVLQAETEGENWNCKVKASCCEDFNSKLQFIASGGHFKINMKNYPNRFLTVNEGQGDSTVVWSHYDNNDDSQLWDFVSVIDVDANELDMPVNWNMKYIENPDFVRERGCSIVCAANLASFYDNKTAYTIQDMIDAGVWKDGAGVSWSKVPHLKLTGYNGMDYLSRIKLDIDNGRPVLICTTNKSEEKDHWIVAYKYINSALSLSDIYVLDSVNNKNNTEGAIRTIPEAIDKSNKYKVKRIYSSNKKN